MNMLVEQLTGVFKLQTVLEGFGSVLRGELDLTEGCQSHSRGVCVYVRASAQCYVCMCVCVFCVCVYPIVHVCPAQCWW